MYNIFASSFVHSFLLSEYVVLSAGSRTDNILVPS